MLTGPRRMVSLFAVLVIITLAIWPHPNLVPRASAADGQFGPMLLLLQPSPEQTALLDGLPVSFHARLFDRPANRYIASGDGPSVERIAASGISSRVLDADTTGKVYYFVDASTTSALRLAISYGTIIYGDPLQYLVALPKASESDFVSALPAAGVPIALLNPDNMVLEQPIRAGVAEIVPAEPDPIIAVLAAQVSEARLYDLMADLSGARPALIDGSPVTIPTRYSFAGAIWNAEAYVRQHYAGLGLPVSTVPWSYAGYNGRNLVIDLPGVAHPERIWVVGGHLDSTSEVPYSSAPGADDNGSGSAATMQLAEILSAYSFSDTIRFVHFSGEEQGMWGSKVYGRDLAHAGAQVMGYVDLDMIGWDSDDDRTVELHSGTGAASISLANAFISANERYTQGLRLELKQNTASRFSDHSSFWDYGYPAFLALENFYDDAIGRDRNPWYHTTGDVVSHVNLNYVARTARTALALMAESAGLINGVLPTATPTPTATATATSTSTPTRTPTATATPTLSPLACEERIVNGGFDANSAWGMPLTAYTAGYTTAAAHTGLRSLRAGIDTPPDRYAYSDGYQVVAIPASAATATLHAWWFPRSAEGSLLANRSDDAPPAKDVLQALVDGTLPQGVLAGDRQYVLILDTGGRILATLMWTRSDAQAWLPLTFDLAAYRGRAIQVRFGVYNDGNGLSTVMYVDDASLLTCPPMTPTPTATPTASPTLPPRVWVPLLLSTAQEEVVP